MAKAYSDDLRQKLLEAHRLGEGSLRELAHRFRVSVGWARKISAALHQTGKMERQPGAKRGRKSRITREAMDYLQSRVRELPDRTLAELREDLRHHQKIEIGITRLWTVLKEMGLRLKKSRYTPPNRTASASKPSVSSGGKNRNTSIRRNSSLWTKAASQRK